MSASATPSLAYIGLGGNIGNTTDTLQKARTQLCRVPAVRHRASSSLYRTAPIGYLDQPDFINAVVAIETSLHAEALLDCLQEIERQFGRARSFKNAPRTLDLDLLAFDHAVIQTDRLTLPHPEIARRLFVLAPLLEIAPNWTFPDGRQAVDCRSACRDQMIQTLLSPDWPALNELRPETV